MAEPQKEKSPAASHGKSKFKPIEDYFNTKYDFRYNSIKRMPEFISVDNLNAPWKLVTDYQLNTWARELDAVGYSTATSNIWELLCSSYSPYTNPITSYFDELPAWDNTDYIAALCKTVKVHDEDKWIEYFKKWLTGVVANVFIEGYCANHLCLVLTGTQGKFKTTWLDNLCPPSLREHYIYTGKIDPNNKDVLTYISEYLFINIDDQLRQLNKQDENQLKNLITTPSVKYRRPYDRAMSYYPHTASFMASVNGNDFLTDPTGNRRFLPFEVKDIDIDAAQKIDIDKVYIQAVHLYKSKFQYWFDQEQVTELHTHNQLFQVTSKEEELLIEYYELPAPEKPATHMLTRSMIITYLENITKGKLNEKKLSEALVKHGFHKSQKTITPGNVKWVWHVIQKDVSDVMDDTKVNRKPAMPPLPNGSVPAVEGNLF